MITSILDEIDMAIDNQTTLVHLNMSLTQRYIKWSFIHYSANDSKKKNKGT
jgi:hypothetical protein